MLARIRDPAQEVCARFAARLLVHVGQSHASSFPHVPFPHVVCKKKGALETPNFGFKSPGFWKKPRRRDRLYEFVFLTAVLFILHSAGQSVATHLEHVQLRSCTSPANVFDIYS